MADKKDFVAAFGGYMNQRPVSPVDRIVTGQPTAKPAAPVKAEAETATARINIRIQPETRRALEEEAAKRGVTLSWLAKKVITDYVKTLGSEAGEV